MTTPDHSPELLVVDQLTVTFDIPSGPVTAVNGISFDLRPGQILGIVGESGSGKSVTSRAIMSMVRHPGRITNGSVRLRDRELTTLPDKQMRKVRGKDIAMIFQDPQSVLNPVLRIMDQIVEAMRIHGVDEKAAQKRALDLLAKVGIPNPEQAAAKYPHEFSGGMRQRVVIAIALANNPSILIADEPTTALDVTVQAQILQLLRDLRDDLGIAILFITHDMGVVAELCDDILVMYRGDVVESGPVKRLLSTPSHPYTQQLLAAVPRTDAPLRTTPSQNTAAPVLEVKDLKVDVNTRRRSLFRAHDPFFAVNGVSMRVHRGETLALVGESGCGKSTLSRTIVGINEPADGEILVDGHSIERMDTTERRAVARTIQYVFQDPYSSLNPRRTAGQSLAEALTIAGVPRQELRERSVELLERVSLPADFLDRYPWAFSGGQRQRIGIARALAGDPDLLILDEPVSALDVSIQAQILDLLVDLQERFNLGYLFISHDLAVVRAISHRVAVMYKGELVEQGTTKAIFETPAHPYTQKLLSATPDLHKAMA